jgi:hypothetical protein
MLFENDDAALTGRWAIRGLIFNVSRVDGLTILLRLKQSTLVGAKCNKILYHYFPQTDEIIM